MKCITSGVATALLMTGCLNVPPEPISAVPTPVCATQAQCDAMWDAAREWVSRISRMQVAQVSQDAIVTYPRVESDRTTMTGTVMKRPLQDGKYEVSAQFQCWDPQSSCARLEQSGVSLFNTMVTAAGE
jgi:hypothetical protein